MAVNGILNTAERAGQLAYQNAPLDKDENKPDSIVLVHIAPASTSLGDILVAGYEKMLASKLGYSNADITYSNSLQDRGDQKTLSLGHSRGTIVQRNALTIAGQNGYANELLSIIGVGGGIDRESYVEAATQVTRNPEKTTFTYMRNDPIPVIAAGNDGDFWAALKEFANVWAHNNSAHSCYGTGAIGCSTIASPTTGGPKSTDQQPSNVVSFRGNKLIRP